MVRELLGAATTVGNWPPHLLQMKLCKCDSASCQALSMCEHASNSPCVCVCVCVFVWQCQRLTHKYNEHVVWLRCLSSA